MKTFIKTTPTLALCVLVLAGCGDPEPEPAPAPENPQTESSLITFYNVETDSPLMTLQGRCQVIGEDEVETQTINFTCQTGRDEYEDYSIVLRGEKNLFYNRVCRDNHI